MKLNKLMETILIIAIFMVFIGAVAATDSMNDTVVTADNENIVVESNAEDSLSAGNAWYVKSGSTGGDGSEDNPYANLKSVTNNANYKENDIIYVMDGTYKGTNNYGISLKENTTVMAYDGAKPVFDAQNQKSIFVLSNNGIIIKGLSFLHGGGTYGQLADGSSAWAGGAIFNTGDNLTVDNCTFKNPDTLSYGSGIYTKGKNTEIKNSYFNNNQAQRGGAIAIDGPYAKIINNTFEENSAQMGGAINIYNYGGALIENNTFNKNRANYGSGSAYAGAIYARAGNNIIKNNKFDRNTAKSYGGALCLVNPNNIVDNCTFTNNQIFNQNTAANFGGAIYTQSPNVIKNSEFVDNAVRDNGGAIYVKGSDNLIENCTFEKNWAARGGAIYIADIVSGTNITNPVIDNCTFNNNGVEESKGGAVYSKAQDTHIYNSNFNNNIAMEGGAVLYKNGHNYLENDTFTGNRAVKYGGGAVSSVRFGDTINNCTFDNNYAQGYGGAVSADYPTITNSTFTDNHGNHGAAICTITANVSDCKFYDNSAIDNYVILAATQLNEKNNVHPGQEVISMNHTTYFNIDYDQINEIASMPGYYAYCAEEYADYPEYGVLWENLRYMQNALDEEPVGEYLKILILKYWQNEDSHHLLQAYVNQFTDQDFRNCDNETLKPVVDEIVSLYDSGYRVPNDNAIRVLPNGTIQVFNFREVITPSSTQNVFAFNISDSPNATVTKEIITKGIYVNNAVEFNITVTNTGDCNLTRLWINDTDFSEGLTYKSFKSSYNWTYDEKAKLWILNDELAPGKTADIILTFIVTKSGNMTNNVTTGIGNLTLGNDTANFTVYAPNMTIEKISNDKIVKIGEMTSFTIVVKNTGDCNLTGVYVVDNGAEGLEYEYTIDNSGKWSYEGNGKWVYNDVLGVGESASFTIVFEALTEGFKVNNAIAGNNLTNDTVNSTNTTNVTVEKDNKTDVPENETPEKPVNETDVPEKSVNETADNSTQPHKEVKTNVDNATGNPIMALLAVLLLMGVTSIRKFKK